MQTDIQGSVTLTGDEIQRVVAFAQERHQENQQRRRARHTQGWRPRGKQAIHLRTMGYLGEFAFAKWLGIPWRSDNRDHFREAPDVGGWDVKTTDNRHHRLIVTPQDALDRRCVLVIDQRPEFHIVGWFRAGDARRSEWWERHREGGGAWYVPRGMMRLIDREAHLTPDLTTTSGAPGAAQPDGTVE